MTEYERSLERIADRALARRKLAHLPAVKIPVVRTPKVRLPRTDYWQRILDVMTRNWMRVERIALKADLTTDQVRTQILKYPKHRKMLVNRGNSRSGFEWRLK